MRTIVIAALLLFFLPAQCQIPGMTHQKHVDSLFRMLPGSSGERHIDLLNALSQELSPRSFDSAFRYAREAYLLADRDHYERGKGLALFNIGNAYFFYVDIKNTLKNYLAALRILEQFEPSKDVGVLLFQLAAVNQYVYNADKVATYFKRASRNFLAIGDSSAYIDAITNLASGYFFIWQNIMSFDTLAARNMLPYMDSAILYLNIGIKYYRKPRPLNRLEMTNEEMLVNYYNQLGCSYFAKNDPLSAEFNYMALELSERMRNPRWGRAWEGVILSNLGADYFFRLNSPDKGLEYWEKGLKLLRTTIFLDQVASALSTGGFFEMERKNYQAAEGYFLEAIEASDDFLIKINTLRIPDAIFRLWSVTQLRFYRIQTFAGLVSLYELRGDFKKALEIQKRLEAEQTIQSRDELARHVVGLEANYEDELKRKEIDGLKKDNELRRLKMSQSRYIFGGIAGALLILFLAAMAWFQRRRSITEQKSLVLEQKLLRSQMNPHFIFNSLTNIQNFILTEKPEKANIYLSKFAGLLRNILDNSVEEYVVLEKEIETLENYLELQKIRFAGKFDYRIRVADEIDTETMKIPPMLAQPFIENSIEHGIKHRETPGMIDISFSINGNRLVFQVEDNGIGREKAREIGIVTDPKHRSMATSLTRERIANLNRTLREKIRLDIIDLKNTLGEAEGTRVEFSIPI